MRRPFSTPILRNVAIKDFILPDVSSDTKTLEETLTENICIMSGRRGRNIAFTKQDEPAFIRQFKERVGYKEEPSIEDKHASPAAFDDSDEESGLELDDYKPQVVVLKKGDLTAEEAEKHFAEQLKQDKSDDEDSPAGRIMFKKPTKRVLDDADSGTLVTSSVKRPKKVLSSIRTIDKDGPRSKKLDNSKLLSFNADEDIGDEED